MDVVGDFGGQGGLGLGAKFLLKRQLPSLWLFFFLGRRLGGPNLDQPGHANAVGLVFNLFILAAHAVPGGLKAKDAIDDIQDDPGGAERF